MQFSSIRFNGGRPLLKEITAERLNAIVTEIRRLRPLPGRGITTRATGDGIAIDLAATTGGGTTSVSTHPFQISSVQDPENENSYIIRVLPGTLNGLLPTNTFADGALTEFSVGEDEVAYVKLVGATDGTSQFVSCEIVVDNEPAAPQIPTAFSLPTDPEFLLGVVYNAAAYNTISDSLTVIGQIQFTTDREEAPQPGELPYVSWYVWAAP